MTPAFPRRLFVQLAAACLPMLCASPAAIARAYPAKPIVIKVAFPAGGPADASIRAASVVLQRSLGQPVLADNLPGANGSIAAMNVLKSNPDGYTLLGMTGTDFLIAPLSVASAKYHPETFKLVGLTGQSDFVLLSSPELSFKNVDDLIAFAKKPGNKQLSIAHWGNGSTPHLVATDFQARTGIQLLEVPYKGGASTLANVAGDQVDLTFIPLAGPTLGMILTGRLKAIGIASLRRNLALPDVSALSESKHLPNFEHSLWAGIVAPPNTPDAVVARLASAMNDWVVSPENKARIASNTQRKIELMNPAQAATFLKSEHDKFNRIARTVKFNPQ